MKNPDSYIQIFSISKSHGLDGSVRAFALYPLLKELQPGLAIFLNLGNNYIPYFISAFKKLNEDHFIIHFEEVSDRNAAELLAKKHAFLPAEQAREFFDLTEDALFEYLNFEVKEENGNCLGKIEEFVDAPGQDMVLILGQYGEILMPWHPDWIIDTDTEYNSVTVNLPDGFLDIYISP